MSILQEEPLAIVIPAYKKDFLERTLKSISSQTDQRFRVYVGDDGSQENLEEIVRRCSLSPNRLIYHRFDKNLGRVSLVRHWERCIALSEEPWIWLFSDDDVMEQSCVSSFFEALEKTDQRYDVYRFDTAFIDDNDHFISINPPHPQWEPWYEYLFFYLKNWRLSNQQELIFRRSAFEEIGGFIDFPLAWWSDIAFTLTCSAKFGIAKISGAKLLMRKSNINISSVRNPKVYRLKLIALIEFTKWLMEFIESQNYKGFPDKILLKQLIQYHFFFRLKGRNAWLGPKEGKLIVPVVRELFDIPTAEALARLMHLDLLFLIENVPRLFKRLL